MASFKKGIGSIDCMTHWIVSSLTKLKNVGNHLRGYLMNNLYTYSHIEMITGFIFTCINRV